MAIIIKIVLLFGLSKLFSGPLGTLKAAVLYWVLSMLLFLFARSLNIEPDPLVAGDIAMHALIKIPIAFAFFFLLDMVEDTFLLWLIIFVAGVFFVP